MSVSADAILDKDLARDSEHSKELAIPNVVAEVPFPSGDKLKDELDTIIRQFDSKGFVKLILGYYFFVSERFQLIQEIDSAKSPFNGQRFDIVLRDGSKDLDKLSETEKDELVKVAAREFKIHLMPKPQYMLPIIRMIFDLLKKNPALVTLIHLMKIISLPGVKDKHKLELPSIVIYPILGRENAKLVLDAFRKFFSSYDVKQLGEDRQPRYNTRVNELIYYSNGGGDFKNKLTVDDRTKFLTATKVHFAPNFTSQDPHLLTPPESAGGSKPAASRPVASHANRAAAGASVADGATAAAAVGEAVAAANAFVAADTAAAAAPLNKARAFAAASAEKVSDKTQGEDDMMNDDDSSKAPKDAEKDKDVEKEKVSEEQVLLEKLRDAVSRSLKGIVGFGECKVIPADIREEMMGNRKSESHVYLEASSDTSAYQAKLLRALLKKNHIECSVRNAHEKWYYRLYLTKDRTAISDGSFTDNFVSLFLKKYKQHLELPPTQVLEPHEEDAHGGGEALAPQKDEPPAEALARKPSSIDEGSQRFIKFVPPPPPPPTLPPPSSSQASKALCFSATALAVAKDKSPMAADKVPMAAAAAAAAIAGAEEEGERKVANDESASAKPMNGKHETAAAMDDGAEEANGPGSKASRKRKAKDSGGGRGAGADAGGGAGAAAAAPVDPLDWGERKIKKRRNHK